jgi:hypothetical protein
MEEKALEGRTPTRVRFGSRAAVVSATSVVRAAWSCDSSFPFPEVARARPPRRMVMRVADTEKPLKSRRSRVRAGPRKDKRGEAPRGVPRAGRSKTLKGKPHGCWAVDGPSSGASCGRGREPSGAAKQGASRREGTQTLRAEGAGRWNSRVNRTCCAGMCRRGQNSRSAVGILGPSADADGAIGLAHLRKQVAS